jgi:hypothetical protein
MSDRGQSRSPRRLPVSAAVPTARAGLPRPAPADIPAGTDTAANIRLIPVGGGCYLRTKHTGRRAVTRCTCLLSETRCACLLRETRCTCLLKETRCTCLLRETRCACLRGTNLKHPDQVPSLRAIRRGHVRPSITRVQRDVRYAPRAVQSGGGAVVCAYIHLHVCIHICMDEYAYVYTHTCRDGGRGSLGEVLCSRTIPCIGSVDHGRRAGSRASREARGAAAPAA